MGSEQSFHQGVKKSLQNKELQNRTQNASVKHQLAMKSALGQFADLELARKRAAYIKWRVNENLDKYLVDFEGSLMRKGGKVIWADSAATALNEIEQIIKRNNAKSIVKSKSSICNEIGLNEFVRAKGYKLHETDLGDFIVDGFNEKPFHTILPAMHKSKEEINNLLNQTISSSLDIEPEQMTSDVREHLREKYYKADIGITGANFLIADSGMACITENEGNVRLCSTFVKTHIIIAGIDKIIPTLGDVDLFFSLLASYGTGQYLTAYNTIVGPKNNDEFDGPNEFIVVLVDNGRSNILAAQDQREALSCIKCGACHFVCPIFKNIGGHAYESNYTGPIGMVTEPLAQGLSEDRHLAEASTSCGKCNDVCPVNIDISNHIIRNRRDVVNLGKESAGNKLAWYTWTKAMLSRKNLNKSTTLKNFTFKQLYKSEWGNEREFPKIEDKSFNQLWREKFGGA
ncbi:MAG: LUD domain-containing protein [Bacteroidota bacterium]